MLLYRLLDDSSGNSKLQVPIDEVSEDLQQEVLDTMKGQQVRTAAMISEKAKMQLKVIHILGKGSDDDFSILGQPKVYMVDRKVDTYQSLKEMVLNDYFEKD